MNVINRAFDDIASVDYITVRSVSDSAVMLDIYLTTLKAPEMNSKLYETFNERCIILGKMLDRNVQISFIPAKWFNKVKNKISLLFMS